MADQRKIGFFALLMPGASSAYTAASASWLFSGAPSSLLRFVHDCTCGAIELIPVTATLTPTGAEAAKILQMPLDRLPRLAACAAVARANGWDLSKFDCLLFGVWGGVCDTGTEAIWEDPPDAPGRWIPTAIFDELAPHNMICHELCHALGFDHSYWLSANTGLAFGEYGDPTDVMSMSDFVPGAFNPSFDPAAGIAQTSPFWRNAGPGLAMATLWRYLPGFPALQPWVKVVDPANLPMTLQLQRAGKPWNGTPGLIVVPMQGGWWTVEYRPAVEWDRSLNSSSIPSQGSGIVIHRLGDLGAGSGIAGYPKSQQVQYIATVPVPATGDLDWDNGQFGIRFEAQTPSGVRIRLGASIDRTLDLVEAGRAQGQETRLPGGIERVPYAGPNCTPGDVLTERIDASETLTIDAQTTGFADARFQFSVNGTFVGTDAPTGTAESDWLVLAATRVNVPKTRFTSTPTARNLPVQWSKDGNRLVLSFRAGDGAYQVTVKVRASDLGTGTFWEKTATFGVETSWIKWPDRVFERMGACLRELARIHPPRDLIPTPPIPIDGPDWTRKTGLEFYVYVKALRSVESTNPLVARGLRTVIADGFGLHHDALLELERQLKD